MPTRQQKITHAIDQIGIGPYQLVVLILGGGIYAAEGSLLLMIGIVAKGLVDEYDFSPLFAGAMATIVFLGLTVGTIIGGVACDAIGRRKPIIITYFGIVAFLVITLLSQGFMMLIVAKFLLGLFMGFGLPAANAIVCECCPVSHRSNIYSTTMILFAIGQMYSAAVIWFISPTLDYEVLNWRMLIGVGTMPPFLLLIGAYFCLLESAHWLMVVEREDEAKSTLLRMARINGKSVTDWEQLTIHASEDGGSVRSYRRGNMSPRDGSDSNESTHLLAGKTLTCSEWCSQNLSYFWRFQSLFNSYYRMTTIIMTYICFASNFAYYGMVYGLPHTLRTAARRESADSDSWSPAAGVFFSALFEIPGVFLAIVLGITLSRKLNITLTFIAASACLSLLIYALFTEQTDTVGMWAIFGVKMFIAAGFIVVYLYLLECYPTIFRATGLAFCMVVGRLGGFCCPFLHDGLVVAGVHYAWFFVAIACTLFLAAIVAVFLPFETKDAPLSDI